MLDIGEQNLKSSADLGALRSLNETGRSSSEIDIFNVSETEQRPTANGLISYTIMTSDRSSKEVSMAARPPSDQRKSEDEASELPNFDGIPSVNREGISIKPLFDRLSWSQAKPNFSRRPMDDLNKSMTEAKARRENSFFL